MYNIDSQVRENLFGVWYCGMCERMHYRHGRSLLGFESICPSQKKALALASACFIKVAYAHDVWRALYSTNAKKIYPEVSL